MIKSPVYIFGGAIGDALLGVQLAHALEAIGYKEKLGLISTRRAAFTGQLLSLVPNVTYEELPRNEWRSWLKLVSFASAPHSVVFIEPFQDKIPAWWKIIARVATLLPGSVEVRCQSRPQHAPRRVHDLSYSPQNDSLFSMITHVVSAWGGKEVKDLEPSLPKPQDCAEPSEPYILFHFFAGAYRRSFPIEKVHPLLTAAREKFPSHVFVLTCAHQEEVAAREMIEGITNVRIEVSPSARDLLCLLTQANVCVGVASGVTHIASHLGVPSVVMCNLSDPCWLPTYAPHTIMLAERENCGCKGNKTGVCKVATPKGLVYRCLYDIKTADVINAMEKQISQNNRP